VPAGRAVWVFYLAPVAVSFYSWRPLLPVLTGIACAILLAVGMLLSPRWGDVATEIVQLNRLLGALLLLGLAVVGRQTVARRVDVHERDWLRAGGVQLAEELRGEQSAEELGAAILGVLCARTGAAVGALYRRAADGRFHRVAGYALPAGLGRASVAADDGVIGRVIRDRRLVELAEVPPDHLPLATALGRSAPRHLAVLPAVADEAVAGFVELGYLQPLGRGAQQLLTDAARPIAIALRSLDYRMRLEELLLQTQRQAEELTAQQEALQAANQSLEAQQQSLLDAQSRLEAQQSELEETNTQLELQRAELETAHDELVQRADELARASQYKSEFLTTISHELRTPLNSALLLSRHLADNLDGNLTAEQTRYATTIHEACNDLLLLINDILDLSRIEAGRMEIEPERISVASLVQGLTRTFEPLAGARGLAFRAAVAPGSPAELVSDPLRLQQILRNLLANAVKFTDAGEIELAIRPRDADRLELAVRDTGVGIAPEQQEAIFEPFRQGDGDPRHRRGGSGLGLAIARELARRLGGELTVQSAPGEGSTFLLVVPVELPAEAAGPAPGPAAPLAAARVASAPPPPGVGATSPASAPGAPALAPDDDRDELAPDARVVLVIEDDRRFARILYDLAHERGFRCVLAATADEGLRLAERHPPSAVVLDMHLPDHSGLIVLERLKREPATRHVPVHVVSVADYQHQALELGAVGYAHKPVKREELVRAFERLARQVEPQVRQVLLVDASPAHRDEVIGLIRAENVEVTAVADGASALEALRQTSFDCMILDLELPDLTGFELLDRMAGDERCAFPPVLVYGARPLEAEDEQRLRRHASSIVIKGVRSPERLLDEVTLFLHQVEGQLAPAQQRMLREIRNREAALEGRRVLLVEDDVRNVFSLVSVLEPRGIQVGIARNGKEALRALERATDDGTPFDLVLMDVMMPEMDGLTATRELRKRPGWQKLPVIVLTAKAMPDDRARCIEAGASDYIAKPLDVDRLLSLIRVWMPKS
jgi:CheY-like chemotaxis protein/signal transduction histidine kinase